MASTITADNGVSTGSAGLKTAADSTGVLALRTTTAGGTATTALTIDTSQNVGIGTASPGYKLDIYGASLPEMRIRDNTVTYQCYTNTTEVTMGTVGSHPMVFRTAATERARIDSSGNLLVGTTTSPAGSKELVLGGDYIEGVVAIGTVTTASTISLANGTVQTATLTASTACTFTMPTAVAGKSFILLLKQAASTGNGTATFTSVKWSSAGAPTITATAGKMDILSFVSDGTNWYGSYTQGYTP